MTRILATIALATLCAVGCRDEETRQAAQLTGGDPAQGRALVRKYGCGTCHRIPGAPGADGTVGPGLDGIASRDYLAGRLPNTPQNLEHWVRHPQQVLPGNAMPEMGVTDEDAKHLAAYLYTLR